MHADQYIELMERAQALSIMSRLIRLRQWFVQQAQHIEGGGSHIRMPWDTVCYSRSYNDHCLQCPVHDKCRSLGDIFHTFSYMPHEQAANVYCIMTESIVLIDTEMDTLKEKRYGISGD